MTARNGAGSAVAPKPPRVRLAIAEDHAVVAEALATMLGFAEHIEIVGIVASGSAIVDLDAEVVPDVTLMDVKLEGINGIEATRAIVGARPEARVVVLTMHDDPDTVTKAMAAGAVGFLPKNATRTELVAAIDAVARGEGYLHSSVTRTFLDRVGPLADRSLSAERLTDRERDVLEHLVEGASTREIAEALIVSDETVKSHLAHIYQKLGAKDRAHAVALALRQGLVQ